MRTSLARSLALLLVLFSTVGLFAFSTAHAHAATALLSCSGTHTAHYSPGVTNQPQTITITVSETLAPCLVPGNLSIVSGSTSFSVTATISCLAAVVSSAPTVTYRWNTTASSTVVFGTTETVKLADGSTDTTSTGSVTAGFAQGSTAVREAILPELDATACSSPGGVTQLSGPVILTFTL